LAGDGCIHSVSGALFGLIQFVPHSQWGNEQFNGGARFFLDSVGTLTGTLINLQPSGVLYFFGAMWSLSVEFQFYFAYRHVRRCCAAALNA
jgi:peptidoglycan/LPS O-acetylase OafA/YrhL